MKDDQPSLNWLVAANRKHKGRRGSENEWTIQSRMVCLIESMQNEVVLSSGLVTVTTHVGIVK